MERFTHSELCCLLATTKSQAVMLRVQWELRTRAGMPAPIITARVMARVEREARADNAKR